MNAQIDWHVAKALLEWQVELGATEAISDAPVNRYELSQSAPAPQPPSGTKPAAESAAVAPTLAGVDPVAAAKAAAAAAPDLASLAEAVAEFDLCDLKIGARNTVFSDGNPASRVMIIGEAPGRDEDMQGLPFVGRAGQMLDRMFAAIGMSRENPDAARALYISNIMPWRPPHNRDPSAEEISMMLPFVARHVALADPDILVLMGNISCHALLGQRGITRLRGKWTEALGRPALPMFHPAYLLRSPHAKREAWADLLALQARLRAMQ